MSRPKLSSLDDRSVAIQQGCSAESFYQVRTMLQGENLVTLDESHVSCPEGLQKFIANTIDYINGHLYGYEK